MITENHSHIRRGWWIIRLIECMLDGSIRFIEAVSFILARLKPKPTHFTLEGVAFHRADHTLWGIAAEVFIAQQYSPPGFEIGTEDVVVDVGAHRGVFVAYAAKRTKHLVIAFEPDRDNFLKLTRLVHDNSFDHVHLYNVALGASNGQRKFYKAQSSSRHTLIGKDSLTGDILTDFYLVEVWSLDFALAQFSHIDLMKMDCEGAEFEILQNTDVTTLAKIRRIALEFHGIHSNEPMKQLTKMLVEAGFIVTIQQRLETRLGMLFALQPGETNGLNIW